MRPGYNECPAVIACPADAVLPFDFHDPRSGHLIPRFMAENDAKTPNPDDAEPENAGEEPRNQTDAGEVDPPAEEIVVDSSASKDSGTDDLETAEEARNENADEESAPGDPADESEEADLTDKDEPAKRPEKAQKKAQKKVRKKPSGAGEKSAKPHKKSAGWLHLGRRHVEEAGGFMVSMVLHVIILVVLALWMLPQVIEDQFAPPVVETLDPLEEELETVELDESLEVGTEMTFTAAAAGPMDESMDVSEPELEKTAVEESLEPVKVSLDASLGEIARGSGILDKAPKGFYGPGALRRPRLRQGHGPAHSRNHLDA